MIACITYSKLWGIWGNTMGISKHLTIGLYLHVCPVCLAVFYPSQSSIVLNNALIDKRIGPYSLNTSNMSST